MQAQLRHDHLSPADAAARLSYLDTVQQKVRRAALAPGFALVMLGAVALAHGLLVALGPHGKLDWVVWIVALVAVRPLLRVLRRRLEQLRGMEINPRLRLAAIAGALVFAVLAIATGANPLVSALAAVAALVAYLSGMPIVSLAAIGTGLGGDLAIRQGLPLGTGHLLVGAALLALGLFTLKREGWSDEPSH
jgi:phosphatidylserine synthase